jgi:histone deacetylase 1/2/histone deacetylase 8
VRGTAQTAIVWDGGRHHALRAKASGFCYVADAVLGILLLAREGVPPPLAKRRPRILYLDMDLHYGDGVATAFASPTHFAYPLAGRPRAPQVLTLSVHHQSRVFFPPGAPGLTPEDTPHPFSLALPLAAFAHAPTYARAWACVEMIKAAWEPDYVVLQLGVDGLPGDRIGQWGAWSPHGVGGSTWVVERVKGWRAPTAVLGGGGYEHANAARAWALATAAIVGRGLPPDTDVPDHEHIEAYAPAFTLEVPESNVPDENTEAALAEAERTFGVLAARIREIVA